MQKNLGTFGERITSNFRSSRGGKLSLRTSVTKRDTTDNLLVHVTVNGIRNADSTLSCFRHCGSNREDL